MSRGRQRRLSHNAASANLFSYSGQVLAIYDWAIAGNKWLTKRALGTKTSADLNALRDIRCTRQHDDVMMGASGLSHLVSIANSCHSSRAWTSIRHRRASYLHVRCTRLEVLKCSQRIGTSACPLYLAIFRKLPF